MERNNHDKKYHSELRNANIWRLSCKTVSTYMCQETVAELPRPIGSLLSFLPIGMLYIILIPYYCVDSLTQSVQRLYRKRFRVLRDDSPTERTSINAVPDVSVGGNLWLGNVAIRAPDL